MFFTCPDQSLDKQESPKVPPPPPPHPASGPKKTQTPGSHNKMTPSTAPANSNVNPGKSNQTGKASDSIQNTIHKQAKTDSNSKSHQTSGTKEHVFLSREKVIIASSTSQAEGPIIALSLGLAFTIILIGLLACRLRNMKHRLRKGRPLSSNEADYLINGMYL